MGIRCTFNHKWKTHAIDSGFTTSYSDLDRSDKHVLVYKECERCGERKFESNLDRYASHNGIETQKAKWLGGSTRMAATRDSEIYDWRYFRAAGIDEMMRRIRNDPEMAKLMEDQPTVKNAVDQLEAVIKMCKNL